MKAGRPKKVSFPIRRIEVVHGISIPRIVEENTAVRCVRCGMMILINADTVYISRDDLDSDIEIVRCPQCNRRACIYHYYDQIIANRKKPTASQ